MSRVGSANTTPEIVVRSLLHRMGFRFRVNRRDLPGTPDIVLPKHHCVVFVHGCFWHRHGGCKRATVPSTRKVFWREKFAANVERDKRNRKELRGMGWRVLVVWECDVYRDPLRVAIRIAKVLRGDTRRTEYSLPTRREVMKFAEKRVHHYLTKRET